MNSVAADGTQAVAPPFARTNDGSRGPRYFRNGHVHDEWGARLMSAQRPTPDRKRSAVESPLLADRSHSVFLASTSAKAEQCELAIRQVSKNSSHSSLAAQDSSAKLIPPPVNSITPRLST